MKKTFLFAALFGLMTFTACDSEETVVPEPPQQEETTEEPKEEEKPADEPGKEILPGEENIFEANYAPRKDIQLGEVQKGISAEMNKFAWKMFAKTFENKKDANLMASPYSLIQNLMMLSNGIEGETLYEILVALDVNEYKREDLNQYILQLNEGMVEADPRTRYRTDNAIWYIDSLRMLNQFSSAIDQFYKAETFPATMTTATMDSINLWAKERTYGRIPKALYELPDTTQSIIMNTVYFRGLWEAELREEWGHLKEGIFHSETGEEQPVRMVYYPDKTTYTEGETFQSTTRRFGNGAYVMDFILPKEGVSAQEVLAEYTEMKGEQGEVKKVELTFPCFETANEITLNKVLESVGIKRMFNKKYSFDFWIFNELSYVNSVIQKTSITVNEQGVEAAAATFETMCGANGQKYETVYMTLDRPFFYAIRETSTNTPLFIGYQGSVAK